MGRKQKKKLNLEWPTREVSAVSNFSSPARNLRKTDLGAVIFGCTHNTIDECFSSRLFGLPEGHYSYIKNISQGLVLFLFNYSDRKLHGIFEAAGPGQMNIDQYAWVADGDNTGYTRYPAQVRIRVRQLCQPLSENEFGPVIANNYYESKLFYFELDHDQKEKLISLFKPQLAPVRQEYNIKQNRQAAGGVAYASLPPTVTTTASSSQPTGSWRALFKSESELQMTNDDRSTVQASKVPFSSSNLNEDTIDCLQVNTWEESRDIDEWPLSPEYEEKGDSKQANTLEDIASTTDEAEGDHLSDLLPQANATTDKAAVFLQANSTNDVEEVQPSNLTGQHLDKPSYSSQPLNDDTDCNLSSSIRTSESDKEEILDKDNSSVPGIAAETSTRHVVADTSTSLQPLVVEVNQRWKSSSSVLESGSRSVVERAEVSECQSMFVGSVFIVGGYDGSSWFPTLDSYSPSHDIKISLSPMNFVKTYPSAATLYGEIYHFGGRESHTANNLFKLFTCCQS